MMDHNNIKVVHPKEAIDKIGLVQQQIQFTSSLRVKNRPGVIDEICGLFQKEIEDIDTFKTDETSVAVENVNVTLKKDTADKQEENATVTLSWSLEVNMI